MNVEKKVKKIDVKMRKDLTNNSNYPGNRTKLLSKTTKVRVLFE